MSRALLARCLVGFAMLLRIAPSPATPLAVPAGWPEPQYRFEDNRPTDAGIELGRQLFYDPRLSADGRIACASCHQQAAAFAHAQHRLSHGIGDRLGTRNAPALFNLAWQPDFMWDGAVHHLELQPLAPLTNPAEMGATLSDVLTRLRTDADYPARFEAAFGSREIDSRRLLRALAQFLASMVSSDSAYDRAQRGERTLDAEAQRGLALFRANCSGCHVEPLFTDYRYRNNGLDTEPADPGRGAISGRAEDRGRFRVPSLRNVALTAPYMHDGRFATLEAVLDHYTHGLQPSPGLDPLLSKPPALDAAQRRALIAFLQTLTDTRFVHDARFAQPDRDVPEAAPGLLARALDWLSSPAQARAAPPTSIDLSRSAGATPTRIAQRIAPWEIVAVRDRDALRVWVDDGTSNAPRSGLDLRLAVGSRRMRAMEEAPGRYRIPLDPAIAPSSALLDVRDAHGVPVRFDFTLPAPPAEG